MIDHLYYSPFMNRDTSIYESIIEKTYINARGLKIRGLNMSKKTDYRIIGQI